MATLASSLHRDALDNFVGRSDELRLLRTSLTAAGPRVVHVSGVAGIGKSALLDVFAEEAVAAGRAVHRFDCHGMEPSELGLLKALAEATGAAAEALPAVTAHLSPAAVLVFDTYELYWLMDTFIRRELCPSLPDGAVVVLAGRNPPVGAWRSAPEWRKLFRAVSLGPLTSAESLRYLRDSGVGEDAARRTHAVARGHPLALRIAAGISEGPGASAEDAATAAVVEDLARAYLASTAELPTREALEAACSVRRVTESLMAAMLPNTSPDDALARLRSLPFTETRRDGLFVHDAVREGIATRLAVEKPDRYRALRVAAWRQLRTEFRHATSATLWRYTADILYLLQKPEIREGFFPSGYQPFAVEPALAGDLEDIRTTARNHEGGEALSILEAWWQHAPAAVRVCRDGTRRASGYCIAIPADHVPESVLAADPVVAGWRQDMLERGGNDKAIFIRRLLDSDEGEGASGSRGAFGLDVKRAYMEMRPALRYVYLGGVEAQNFDWCDPLGFEVQPHLERQIDGGAFQTWRLDMGPGSVDDWLARLVAEELGIAPEQRAGMVFDAETRQLEVAPGAGPATLTRLEAAVFAELWERSPAAVSRARLLERGWQEDTGVESNVVDAVILTLRKKLGPKAAAIESVRGVGYRLRLDDGEGVSA